LKDGGWLDRADKRLRSIPPSRRTLVIILVAVAVLGTFLVLDDLWLNQVFTSAFGRTTDVSFYQDRVNAVLSGKVLYRDLMIESPPLIVFLFVPPQLAGGSNLAYQLYFCFFTVMTALALYWGLRHLNDYRAFMVAILFIFSPITLVESTLGVQDETVIFFLFALAVVLAVRNRDKLSTFVAVVGVWVKVFTGLFYPVLLLRTKSWRDRWKQIGIIAVVSLVVSGPFLILCPVQFLQFPLYYFGIGGGSSNVTPVSGISVWDYLRTAGVDIPGVVLLVLTVGSYVFALWWGKRKGFDLWRATLLVTVAFVVFYSRMWVGYFELPIIFLLPWAAEDFRMALRTFGLTAPLFATLLFTQDNPSYIPIINIPYAWLVGLLLTLLAFYILVDTSRICFSKDSFIQRKGEE